ncbi:hypothetical protein INR49_012767 [Caranx melampygus]|nr:hypothetical protein INR49_012767 [Caranx melampygus]
MAKCLRLSCGAQIFKEDLNPLQRKRCRGVRVACADTQQVIVKAKRLCAVSPRCKAEHHGSSSVGM